MQVDRGDVVMVDFPFGEGTGSKFRPAVVVQCDSDNRRLGATIVAMITKQTALAGREPRHLLIDISTEAGNGVGPLVAIGGQLLATGNDPVGSGDSPSGPPVGFIDAKAFQQPPVWAGPLILRIAALQAAKSARRRPSRSAR